MRFYFLTYAARSGSTMLAHRLADLTDELLVLPEFRVPFLLLNKGDRAIRRMSSAALERLLRSDPQRNVAHLDDAATSRLAAIGVGKGIRWFFEEIVAHYSRAVGQRAETVLLKSGWFIYLSSSIAELFPDAVLVHPFRDPRGAVSSMLRTRDPYDPRSRMARGSVVFAARYWNGVMDCVARAKAVGRLPIIEIQFESLCENPRKEMGILLQHLGIRGSDISPRLRGIEVAEAEREMHALVKQAPVTERSDAWKQDLRAWEGFAVERVTRRHLLARGYSLWYLRGCSGVTRLRYSVTGLLHHAWHSGWHAFFAGIRFVTSPRSIVDRVGIEVNRRRAMRGSR